jgi:hypothetical protein
MNAEYIVILGIVCNFHLEVSVFIPVMSDKKRTNK